MSAFKEFGEGETVFAPGVWFWRCLDQWWCPCCAQRIWSGWIF